jgi:hypothetical protein
MPRGDQTGPNGEGPMTGRGMGYCNGYDRPGFANFGRGRGMGRGFRHGFRRGFGFRRAPVTPVYREPTKEDEAQFLEEETKAIEEEQKVLKEELDAIKKRLAELKK